MVKEYWVISLCCDPPAVLGIYLDEDDAYDAKDMAEMTTEGHGMVEVVTVLRQGNSNA